MVTTTMMTTTMVMTVTVTTTITMISITIVHCPACGAQLRPRRPRMPTIMSHAARAHHALEALHRSRLHGGEAVVTPAQPMRQQSQSDVLQAAGEALLHRACDAMDRLSAERQVHVQFAASLGAAGASFMKEAHTRDAAEHDALQDEAKGILRRGQAQATD